MKGLATVLVAGATVLLVVVGSQSVGFAGKGDKDVKADLIGFE